MRYWDGGKWTNDIARPTPTYRPRKSIYRSWWAILLMVLTGSLALLVVAGIAVAILASDTTVDPAPSDRSLYRTVTPRELAQVIKDPDAHAGDLLVIYGEVTQLDSATGTSDLRADVSARPLGRWDFGDNAMVAAPDPEMFAEVVQGDRIQIWVEVEGAYSYETQIGGETTVPRFVAGDLQVIKAKK